jgi:hypothetical protein
MKKTFSFAHPKKQRPRVADAIKHELKKYIKPDEMDFWDFDCRFGADEASSGVIHVSEINKVIAEAHDEGLDTFFLEVLAKPAKRTKKPESEKEVESFLE